MLSMFSHKLITIFRWQHHRRLSPHAATFRPLGGAILMWSWFHSFIGPASCYFGLGLLTLPPCPLSLLSLSIPSSPSRSDSILATAIHALDHSFLILDVMHQRNGQIIRNMKEAKLRFKAIDERERERARRIADVFGWIDPAC